MRLNRPKESLKYFEKAMKYEEFYESIEGPYLYYYYASILEIIRG